MALIRSGKTFRALLGACCFVLLAGAPPAGAAGESRASSSPTVGTGADYKVGPGDKLAVSIRAAGSEAIDFEVPVAGDGTLDVVYLGKIKVAGLSTTDVQSRIKGALQSKDIIKQPHVAVNVTEYLSQGVNVSGLVRSPGRIFLKGFATVLDVLSAAGGVDEEKAGPIVQITRAGQSAPILVRRRALFARDAEVVRQANVAIQADDNMYVAAKMNFCILGPVKRSGCFPVEEDMNILQAISVAEGLDEKADRRRATIKRRTATGVEEVLVDLEAVSRGLISPPAIEGDDQILIAEGARTHFCVRGPVAEPDCYDVDKDFTLGEAISVAGELKPESANRQKITIRRTIDGVSHEVTVSLDVPGEKGAGYPIMDQDQIIVAELQFKVSVDGAVKNPGRIDITPGMTIVDAIAAAGGTEGDQAKFSGALSRTRLTRNGETREVDVKAIRMGSAPDIELEPGDKIYVPAKRF